MSDSVQMQLDKGWIQRAAFSRDPYPNPNTEEITYVSETKPTNNPKDAVGSDKLPLHLFPTTAVAMGALGNLDGMLKYGRTNWREAGIRYTIYLDAIKRHADALLEGEDIDPDSGLPHEAHILASAGIIVDAAASGNLIDDRNYKGRFYREWLGKMTSHVKRLKDKHADKKPKHWTIGDQD